MEYFIADTHFGHQNIIKMNNRPFSSVEEMDEIMIKNWNEAVKSDNDDVYIIGDLCYKSGKNPVEYLKQLKGKKHLIIGNHDGRIIRDPVARKMFVDIKDMSTIWINGKMIVLCHYPMAEWNGFFRGSVLMYGHIHNNIENDTYKIMKNIRNAYNCGVDILGYKPRTFEEVIEWNQKFFEEH